MTLTLEIPEAIEHAAAASQTDVRAFILAAAAEKAARVFDEQKFGAMLDSDPLAALDYLLEVSAPLTAGTEPLRDDAVARSYEEYYDHKAST